ncbi:MAG: ABC transporter permease, partial [Chloroflexi bacterium]|nr:ABC transporter permease [Chloroflexota bacterium]
MARPTLSNSASTQPVPSHPRSPSLGRISVATLMRLFAPIIVLVLLMLVFTVLNPRFLSPLNFVNILRQSSVLMVVALGETFIIMMGSIDLSMSSIITLCGLVGAMLIRDHGE